MEETTTKNNLLTQLRELARILKFGRWYHPVIANETCNLAVDEIEKLREELAWYGHKIAGGAPLVGYAKVARECENRWYEITSKILNN
jgi:hypothetical protein